MIESIFELLRMYPHTGKSEVIDIAKGKYRLPLTLDEKKKQQTLIDAWKRK